MYAHTNQRRLWRVISILAMAFILVGGQIAQAQPPEPAPAPAPEFSAYMPLIIRGGAIAPRAAVRFVADSARASHAEIGPEGGILSAVAADGTRFDLLISPDALDFTETITMTPVLRAENLPLSGGLIGAVNLEPAGLDLYTPALLRILSPTSSPNLQTIGFTYDGDGAQFHLRPISAPAAAAAPEAAAEPVANAMALTRIRPVGMALGTPADIDAQQAQPEPDDPIDALEQYMLDVGFPELEKKELQYIYDSILRPVLQRAQADDQLTDEAIRRFESWMFWVDKHDLRPRFSTQFFEGRRLIASMLKHSAGAAAERCFSQKRPEEGFRLLRWIRYARTYAGAAEIALIEAKLAKCLRFELKFHSVITETANGYGYWYELRMATTLRAAGSTRATGSAPLEWVDLHWTGGGPCQFTMQGTDSTFDAASGRLGFNMTPVSRSSPAVKLTLRYTPGVPAEHTTMACPEGGGFSVGSTAWSSYFTKMHANEKDSAGYRATAQIVNAGSFSGWVYHLTTTGPGNQAVVEDTQIDLVHAPER